MKTIKNLFFLLTFSLFAFNCSSDDDNSSTDDGGDDDGIVTEVYKSGILTSDETWSAENIYVLGGKVVVNEGVTLTIEAGTIIKGAEGQESLASALVVDQGGKVMAEGTASNPIIMTSILDNITVGQTAGSNLDSNDVGLWGGLIILGRAPISVSGDVETAQIEGIPATEDYGQYGGTDATDNSGTYKYISVRHGGITIGSDNEINGITLGGVGSGTTLDNLEVVSNQDDGFEWFGGTVNATNLITWGDGDDGLDADQAWSGTVTNAVVILGSESGSALELDGPEGSVATEAGYTFNDITLIGNASTSNYIADCRDGLIANMNNVLVYNFGAESTVRISGDDSHTELAAGRITFSNWEVVLPTGVALADIFQADANMESFTDNATAITATEATTGADTSVFGWTYAASQNAF
ncbi:hypothetical protein HSX10_11235 [Winogradskyella undariae]|uniref:hypothetical protein n=1 Tax=Winogradskyella TaxID=286104 RepID=UPI00156AF5FE|nr:MULTISPECIES: hypothetical protein [Winogradskyella]NRR92141.1 hypothetical protein [Winogradskyella undariae]QNK77189.1 hypothetical protein H7F37_13895 [Winogradskyella sp. PAMC22761]QXP80255.1 hypothetical protein H0I32_06420 [Winogradskyella sp. HaHa_3_26]